MKTIVSLVAIAVLISATACAPAPTAIAAVDPSIQETAIAELLAVHESGNQAHIDTDVAALLEHAGDEFIAVSNGQIYRQTKADSEAFFTRYFEGAVYSEYVDTEPPIVRASADGKMGWVINRLSAKRTAPDADGVMQPREFIYAGIMLYEKHDGKWLRVANVSTFE